MSIARIAVLMVSLAPVMLGPVILGPLIPGPVSGGAATEEPPPGGRWLSMAEGLEAARRDYRPILLVYLAEEAAAAPPAGPGLAGAAPAEGPSPGRRSSGDFHLEWRAHLTDAGFRKALKGFICVELPRSALGEPYPAEKPLREAPGHPPGDPRLLGERLGLVGGVPALLILDFRERVIRRHQEKVPRREALVRELSGLSKHMAQLARAARRVEKVLESAEYSYALGETREAVLLLLPFDDPKARRSLDSTLADRLTAVIARYRKDAGAAIATGEALEVEERYLEAIQAYRQAAQRFPFTDVVRTAQRKQGEAWRKMQGGL